MPVLPPALLRPGDAIASMPAARPNGPATLALTGEALAARSQELTGAIFVRMPVISMFYGLIVAMYYLDTKQHHHPHIHVRYGELEAVFRLPDGQLLDGDLPKGKIKLMEAWIELHQDELMANWQLAITGQRVFPIEPLK